MSKNVFLISDTHFGHGNICNFLCDDGSKVRPWDNVEEMDEALVQNWNNVVRPHDKVYHLGDVVINKKHLPIMERLNGDKVLIRGNHDIFDLKDYVKYFRDVRAYHIFQGHKIICSHIPLHPDSARRFKGNFHGHLHQRRILRMDSGQPGERDPFYLNFSVEQINYTPMALEVAFKLFNEQGE